MSFALFVNADGNLEQIGVGDTLNVDDIDVAGTGNMTIGASLGTGDELQLGAGTSGDGDVRVLSDLYVDNDLYVTGSSAISVDETVTGTFNANGNVNLGDNVSAGTINLGGGSNDSVYLLGDALIMGNNTRGIGTSATDAADEIWLSSVVGGAGSGINLNATGNGTSGAEAIGVYTGGLTISPATDDLQTVIEALDAAISAGGGESLQQTYAIGNTISVTTANGALQFSNSTDATDVLEVSRTFVGAGIGIDLQMGPGNEAVTGIGMSITSGTGATGDMLFINNLGSGDAIEIQDGGNTVFRISGSGAVTVGNNSVGSTTINGTFVQISPQTNIDMLPGANSDVNMTVGGSGSVDITNSSTPTGTLVRINNTGTGLALDVQDGGTPVLQVDGAGAVDITPTSGQSLTMTTAGVGDVDINVGGNFTVDASSNLSLDAAGAVNLTASGSSSVTVNASGTGNVTVDAVGGELFLDDTGSWGGSLSQSGDRTLTQTGAGEVLNGATSLIGAINRLADNIEDEGVEQFVSYPIENGVTLAAGDCVSRGATAGRVQLSDADGTADQKKFVGICRTGGTGDAGGTVIATVWTPGALCTGAGFTAGGALFVPDTPGDPTNAAPSTTGDLLQRVGWALSTTQFILDPGPPVIL